MELEPGIEVRGADVSSHFILKAFRLVPTIAYRVFAKHGMGRFTAEGRFVEDLSPWWPLEPYLAALFEINETVGQQKMVEIGTLIAKYVTAPSSSQEIRQEIRHEIRSAVTAIDIAYHLNHRKNGIVMFDLATGQMTEGIGHYVRQPGERGERGRQHGSDSFFTIETDSPYPCDVDRGILIGFARRFEPRAVVDHGPGHCRKKGEETCVYQISW